MHITKTVATAQDLFDLLKTIPREIREQLPVEVLADDGMTLLEGPFDVEAFEERETEGCIERGFRFVHGEEFED